MKPMSWCSRAGLVATAAVMAACAGQPPVPRGPALPEPSATAEPERETGEGAGCPDEPDVTVLLSLEVSKEQRWMMHERQIEGADDPLADSEVDARKLSVEEAKALSLSEQGGTLWVFFEAEAPACRMETGDPWAIRIGDGAPVTQIAYEVEGTCRLSHEQGSYLAMRSNEAMGGCRSHGLATVDSDEEGAGKQVPAALQAVLPANQCEGEKCFRWILRDVHLDGGLGLMEAAAVWIHPPEGDDPPCAAPFDGFHEVFLQLDRQAAWKPVAGMSDVRSLFYDARGLRAVVADARGMLELWVPNEQGELDQVWRKPYMSWNEENQTPMDMIQPSCL